MERDEALALFEGLTSAPAHVAEHVLDAVRPQHPRRAMRLCLARASNCHVLFKPGWQPVG